MARVEVEKGENEELDEERVTRLKIRPIELGDELSLN